MPTKPLPKKLVSRLKKITDKREQRKRFKQGKEEISGNLGSMKNIDHRRNDPEIKQLLALNPKNISSAGGRVREMDVSKQFPGIKLVIKKIHVAPNSIKEINEIKKIVKSHNKSFEPENYVLREPIAYALGNGLVAMAKTNKPNLDEILGSNGKTIRGQEFFRKLKKKHRVTKTQLNEAFGRFYRRTKTKYIDFPTRNILLLGVKNGKFVFMPLVDLQ